MKKRISLVFFNLFLSLLAFSKTTNLEEALRKKWVSSTVVRRENEETKRRDIQISLKNLTKEDLIVNIPVGFVFQAEDSTVQDFIHLENKDLVVPSLASNSMLLRTSCIRAKRGCSSKSDVFLATTLASSHLLALAKFAYENNLYNLSAMQSALWAISDDHDLVGIDNLELAKFVAQRLNKPLPDYTVRYHYNDTPGMRAETALEPLAIKGLFYYTLSAEQQVKLDLVNAAGKSVLQELGFVQMMTQPKGQHKFTFSLKLRGVARGTYFVKMTTLNEGTELASKEVVF